MDETEQNSWWNELGCRVNKIRHPETKLRNTVDMLFNLSQFNCTSTVQLSRLLIRNNIREYSVSRIVLANSKEERAFKSRAQRRRAFIRAPPEPFKQQSLHSVTDASYNIPVASSE